MIARTSTKLPSSYHLRAYASVNFWNEKRGVRREIAVFSSSTPGMGDVLVEMGEDNVVKELAAGPAAMQRFIDEVSKVTK